MFVCILSFLAIFQSCNNSKVTQSKNNFEVLMASEYGGFGEDKIQIFSNSEEFNQFWQEVNLDTSLQFPSIDFDKKMVVAKHFQSQRSGGNEFKVHDVNYSGNEINVIYSAINSSEFGTMAITNPLIVLVVNKTENPKVNFNTQKK